MSINTCKCHTNFYGAGISCEPCLKRHSDAYNSGCPFGSSTTTTCRSKAPFYGFGSSLYTLFLQDVLVTVISIFPFGSYAIDAWQCNVGFYGSGTSCPECHPGAASCTIRSANSPVGATTDWGSEGLLLFLVLLLLVFLDVLFIAELSTYSS